MSYDLHENLKAYRRNGVKEYIVWPVLDKSLDWFKLQSGEFELQQLDSQGIHTSTVFPGLWLDAAALLAGQPAQVLQGAQQGIATAEHAAFVEELSAAGRGQATG